MAAEATAADAASVEAAAEVHLLEWTDIVGLAIVAVLVFVFFYRRRQAATATTVTSPKTSFSISTLNLYGRGEGPTCIAPERHRANSAGLAQLAHGLWACPGRTAPEASASTTAT